jgi:hypothetical protein
MSCTLQYLTFPLFNLLFNNPNEPPPPRDEHILQPQRSEHFCRITPYAQRSLTNHPIDRRALNDLNWRLLAFRKAPHGATMSMYGDKSKYGALAMAVDGENTQRVVAPTRGFCLAFSKSLLEILFKREK